MALSGSDEYFDRLEVMTAEARSLYFERKIAQTVRYAYRNAPAARRQLDSAGVKPSEVRTLKDMERLPIIRKVDVIDWQKKDPPYGGLFTGSPDDAERIFISPGPIYEPHQIAGIKWFAKSFWAAGIRKGDIVINTFTYHMSPAGILFHEAARHCGATVIPMGTGNTDVQVQAMRDLKITVFVGTPSFLMTVIKRTEELGLSIKNDLVLKRAWFTGEMVAPSVRKTLENDYHINTFQTYAVTEPGGTIAYECREKTGMHFMDDYAIEIVDPATGEQLEPGEVGEIVVTPLHNKTWGLLRFGTGDLSSYTAESCPCGRTSYRLTAMLGRAGDAAKVRGMFVVLRQVEQVIAEFEQISRFQLVITRNDSRDELTLRAELTREVSSGVEEELVGILNARFQDLCRVKLDHIEFTGKGVFSEPHQKLVDKRVWK